MKAAAKRNSKLIDGILFAQKHHKGRPNSVKLDTRHRDDDILEVETILKIAPELRTRDKIDILAQHFGGLDFFVNLMEEYGEDSGGST